MQQIKINDLTIDVVSVYGAKRDMLGAKRDSLAIKLLSNYETVVNTFVDDMTYTLIDITITENVDEEGNVTTNESVQEYDKSNYSMAGDVVDHRDGTITVYMGEKTNEELAIEQAEETEQLLYDIMFGE